MRRFFPAALALFILALAEPAYASFRDVDFSDVSFKAIAAGEKAGWLHGYPDGKFYPASSVNRAEFLTIVLAANDIGADPAACASWRRFPDVRSDDWFRLAVCTASQAGWTGGYADGTFKPWRDVSFVEAAKIIALAMDLPLSPDPLGRWYRPAVEALALKNAIPLSITSLSQPLSRRELAEIIYRLQQHVRNEGSQSPDALTGGQRVSPPVFVPGSAAEGDKVGGMTVVRSDFNKTVFSGTIRLRGRYADWRNDFSGKPNGVCMYDFDAGSLAVLPRDQGKPDVCFLSNENSLWSFPAGTEGTAEVTMSQLTRLHVLPETPDYGRIETVVSARRDPESASECAQRGGSWDAGAVRQRQVRINGATDILHGVCSFGASSASSPSATLAPAFETCGSIAKFCTRPWFPAFISAANVKGIPVSVDNVADSCFSEGLQYLVFIMSAKYPEPSRIWRFDASRGVLDGAEVDSPMPYAAAFFGKPVDGILPVHGSITDPQCEVTVYSSYDVIKNIAKVQKSYAECQGEDGRWQYFR